jgi:L-lactate utilization protein LutB
MEALSCPLCEAAVTLKLHRFKKSVMKAFEGWNKIRNKIELSKACSASDLDTVLDSVKSRFKECELNFYSDFNFNLN